MYHYFMGVGLQDIRSSDPGKPYLDFFWHYSEDEYKKWKKAYDHFHSNKDLWKLTIQDSLSTCEAQPLHLILEQCKMRSQCQGGLYFLHFTSDALLTRGDFEIYIKTLSVNEIKNISKGVNKETTEWMKEETNFLDSSNLQSQKQD